MPARLINDDVGDEVGTLGVLGAVADLYENAGLSLAVLLAFSACSRSCFSRSCRSASSMARALVIGAIANFSLISIFESFDS